MKCTNKLLLEAREKFPPGTKFMPPEDKEEHEVSTENLIPRAENKKNWLDGLYYIGVNSILCLIDNKITWAYLFNNGKWAQKVYKKEETYEIY